MERFRLACRRVTASQGFEISTTTLILIGTQGPRSASMSLKDGISPIEVLCTSLLSLILYTVLAVLPPPLFTILYRRLIR